MAESSRTRNSSDDNLAEIRSSAQAGTRCSKQETATINIATRTNNPNKRYLIMRPMPLNMVTNPSATRLWQPLGESNSSYLDENQVS